MRVEAVLRNPPIADVPKLARLAEDIGFDGLAIPEIKLDPFVAATLAADATERLRISTAVALAFPRSPTVTAYSARSIHDLARGRFTLGLGTQVKAHIERRFGVPWGAPAARLREYVQAVRAVWQSWEQGTPLAFEGQYYRLSLMTPEFSPGPSPFGPVPIHVGAVNALNLRLAGELCDGVRLHPFCTPDYLRQVVWPNLRRGADQGGSTNRFEVSGGGFIVTGATPAEIAAGRKLARRQVGFYASTPTYAPVLDLHGWGELGGQLRRLIAAQRWDDLASLITDDVLDELCIAGEYDVIADKVADRLGGLVDWISLPMPDADPADRTRLRSALERLRAIPTATGLSAIA